MARATKAPLTATFIRSIALCAGSGSSVFKFLTEHVDILLTGELSHHEVLAAVAKGQTVILCGHSNTERGFLSTLKSQLQEDLDARVGKLVEVVISSQDHDPLEIV